MRTALWIALLIEYSRSAFTLEQQSVDRRIIFLAPGLTCVYRSSYKDSNSASNNKLLRHHYSNPHVSSLVLFAIHAHGSRGISAPAQSALKTPNNHMGILEESITSCNDDPMTTAAGHCHYRDWGSLPDLPLYNVAASLRTPPDHSAFSRVCIPWRSASAAARQGFMESQPPWLCAVDYDRLYVLGGGGGRTNALYCRKDDASCNRQTGASPQDKRWAVGFSSGYLVLAHSGSLHRLSLADPFTGVVSHRFPDAPRAFSRALLVPPPHPNKQLPPLLVVFNSDEMQCIRPGEAHWRTYRFPDDLGTVRNIASHRGTLYAITWDSRLAAVQAENLASYQLDMEIVEGAECLPFGRFQGTWLGSTGDDLVAVSCTYRLDPPRAVESFTVRRFQFGTGRWEKVRGLGGKALFVDMSWGLLCDDNPGKWGGKGDSVYFTDAMSNKVGVFGLKDGEIQDLGGAEGEKLFRWDLAVWVLPSLCRV